MSRYLTIVLVLLLSNIYSTEYEYYWSYQSGSVVVSKTQSPATVYWRPLGKGTSTSTTSFTPSQTASSRTVSFYLFSTSSSQSTFVWGMGASSDGYGYVEAASGLWLGKGWISINNGRFNYIPDKSIAASSVVWCQYPMRTIGSSTYYVTGYFANSVISTNYKVPVGSGWGSVSVTIPQANLVVSSKFIAASQSESVYLTAVKVPYGTSYVEEPDPNNPSGPKIVKTVQKGQLLPIYTSVKALTFDMNMRFYYVGKGWIVGDGTWTSFNGNTGYPIEYNFDYIPLYSGSSVLWRTAIAKSSFPYTSCPYPCEIGVGVLQTFGITPTMYPSSAQSAKTVYLGSFGSTGSRFTGYSYRGLVAGTPFPTSVGTGFVYVVEGQTLYSKTRPQMVAN